MTVIRTIIDLARDQLSEPTEFEWSDQELGRHCVSGIRDLWHAITTLYDDYYTVVVEGYTVGRNGLTPALPADCYKVVNIEPTSVESDFVFGQRPYASRDMEAARRIDAVTSTEDQDLIYFALTGVGPSASVPEIHFAPRVEINIPVRITYVQSLDTIISNVLPSTDLTGRTFQNVSNVARPDSRDTWVGTGFTTPTTGESQMFLDTTPTTLFEWRTVALRDPGEAGQAVTPETIAYSFSIAHAGAADTDPQGGTDDYQNVIVDVATLFVGRDANNQLLLAVNSDLALQRLFPITTLRIDSLTRAGRRGRADVNLDAIIPLPGDPDEALVAFVLSRARAREREDRQPDPGWVQIYSAEKANLITSLSPRDVGDFPVVQDASNFAATDFFGTF